VFVVHDLLSDAECDRLIAKARPCLERSTVVGGGTGARDIDARRMSETAHFADALSDPLLDAIDERIAALTQIPKRNGEALQVVHYGVGGEFQPHRDYFDRRVAAEAEALRSGGQRRVTMIIYLRCPQAGGETIFPKANLKVVPKKGSALLFYNCTADGKEDPRSLHGGTPVLKGHKWIATKWLRAGPYQRSARDRASVVDSHPGLIIHGYMFFRALVAATRLGVFRSLCEKPGATLAALSRRLRVTEHGLRVLLLSCRALGLLQTKGRDRRYYNTAFSARHLIPDAPTSILPMLEFYDRINYPAASHLEDAIRCGKNCGLGSIAGSGATLYERLVQNPKLESVFHAGMACISRDAADALVQTIDVEGIHRLLDIGGGDATTAVKLAARYPDLRITILDLPSVCARAQATIRKSGLRNVETSAGNFLSDPLPRGADGILLCHIMNIYSVQRNQALLRKCYRALAPGGMIYIFNAVSNEDESGSLVAASVSLYSVAIVSGEGMVYPVSDQRRWLKTVGFRRVTVQRLPGGRALITGRK
jgi:ubiquinone/menaquinone biosynthesis C-methylase UbiE